MTIGFLSLYIYASRLEISFIVWGFVGWGVAEDSRWNFAETFTRIPDLNNNVENFAVDLPRCAAQDIKAGKNKLAISSFSGLDQVGKLLL